VVFSFRIYSERRKKEEKRWNGIESASEEDEEKKENEYKIAECEHIPPHREE
jgi:hypothetical protein